MKLLAKLLLAGLAFTYPAWAAPGKTILDYTSELHLSSEQSAQLKTDLLYFVKHSDELRQQLQNAEKSVSAEIQSHASLEQIQKSLERSEDFRSQLRFQDVTTSRKIRRLLTPEQWQQWQEIKRKNSEKTK